MVVTCFMNHALEHNYKRLTTHVVNLLRERVICI